MTSYKKLTPFLAEKRTSQVFKSRNPLFRCEVLSGHLSHTPTSFPVSHLPLFYFTVAFLIQYIRSFNLIKKYFKKITLYSCSFMITECALGVVVKVKSSQVVSISINSASLNHI